MTLEDHVSKIVIRPYMRPPLFAASTENAENDKITEVNDDATTMPSIVAPELSAVNATIFVKVDDASKPRPEKPYCNALSTGRSMISVEAVIEGFADTIVAMIVSAAENVPSIVKFPRRVP